MKRLKKRIAAVKRVRANRCHANQAPVVVCEENREERVRRLYAGEGGPLVQWLLDEARRRRMDLKDMAREVGVTYGFIAQVRAGIRKPSLEFARASAAFLGVAPAVTMLAGNVIRVSDLSTRAQSEHEVTESALRRMIDDPHLRASVPVDIARLDSEGKRALALLYADISGQDIFGVRQLPEIVRWLQRAALVHEENEFSAAAGHRDTSLRLA